MERELKKQLNKKPKEIIKIVQNDQTMKSEGTSRGRSVNREEAKKKFL